MEKIKVNEDQYVATMNEELKNHPFERNWGRSKIIYKLGC